MNPCEQRSKKDDTAAPTMAASLLICWSPMTILWRTLLILPRPPPMCYRFWKGP